ncbi:MAG: lantibiotic dehydratase C-terminal domain-containing protein, partial [Candidatus Melainabacteria bacterium]|nr:lantibiotic dehydratase C-terminal domain-containing protein [Candidatus Melainabacteria bacterium]
DKNEEIEIELKETVHIVSCYEKRMKYLASRLLKLDKENKLTESLDTILESIVHMSCNRLFGLNFEVERCVRLLLSNSMESIVKKRKAIVSGPNGTE